MTMLIIFAALNSAFRLIVAAILAYKLRCFRETFNQLERAGLSIGAGTSVLTIFVIGVLVLIYLGIKWKLG